MVLARDEQRQNVRAEIAREWWYRAWAERDATLRFGRLSEALGVQNAPELITKACREAQEDERRHAALCAEVARTFDERDPYADTATPATPLGPRSLSASQRLLYELIAFCCVSESMNAALLMAIHEGSAPGLVRDATHALLKDEVQHAKLGWAYLAWCHTHHGGVDFIEPYLERILQATASKNLTESDRFCASWSDPSQGYLSRSQRIEIFARCAEKVIGPGLAQYGIDAQAALAWLAAQDWIADHFPATKG